MDKRESGGFFSRRLVSRSKDSSYNSTDSSLDSQLHCMLLCSFLPLRVLKLIWHTRGTAEYYINRNYTVHPWWLLCSRPCLNAGLACMHICSWLNTLRLLFFAGTNV